MVKIPLTLIFAAFSFCVLADMDQNELNEFADKTKWSWKVVNNFHNGQQSHLAQLELINDSSVSLPKGKASWAIYTNVVRPILTKESNGIGIQFIQGDLYKLTPTARFNGLKAGDTLNIPYEAANWAVSYSDFMPRSFITQDGYIPAVFSATDTEDSAAYIKPFLLPEQYLRYNKPKDHWQLPTNTWRFDRYLNAQQYALSASDAQRVIIPTPVKVTDNQANTPFSSNWQIVYQGAAKSEADFLLAKLEHKLGRKLLITLDNQPLPTKHYIKLSINNQHQPSESYRLNIGADTIQIIGADNAGLFYGIQSLLSVMPSGQQTTFSLPQLRVEDQPYLAWRGFMYDMARNFHGVEATKKLIDTMATYKLNKLHLHLTEDEAWRIEINGLPELTDLGAQRCFDLSETKCLLPTRGSGPFKHSENNGFYSREAFIELLKYARTRHVEIIPEIDLPGHARAAIKSMELRYKKLTAAGEHQAAEAFLLSDLNDKSVYASVQNFNDNSVNVCMDSAYNFIDKVAYELQQMYREAGLKMSMLHLGGDEVGKGAWTASPICDALYLQADSGVKGPADLKAYFTARAAKILAQRGLNTAAWEDGLMYDSITPFPIEQFDNDKVYANAWDNIWEWGVSDRAYRLANEGYHSILSMGTHLYFDHPQEPHPNERGLYWAARYTDVEKVFNFIPNDVYANADFTRTGEPINNLEALVGRPLPELEKQQNIAGIQGHLWSETVRTQQQLGEMLFPRLIALAERAWHKTDNQGASDQTKNSKHRQHWGQFASVLAQKEYPRLDEAKWSFYVPIPGMKIVDGKVNVISQLPGLTLEYSLDNGLSWQVYSTPIKPTPSLTVRARHGTHISRTSRYQQ